MLYYSLSSHKVKVNRENMKYLGEGSCGKVYHDANMIWKEYFHTTDYAVRISPHIFKLLKSIHDPHLIELYDLYYRWYKPATLPFYPDAYTAKYYPDHSADVLTESKDYLLDNFHELDRLFETLAMNRILVDDLNANVRLGKDGIVVIDPDCFSLSKMPVERILHWNKSDLASLAYSLCNNRLADMKLSPDAEGRSPLKRRPEEISLFEVTSQTDVAKELSKKLSSVSRPLDYFVR